MTALSTAILAKTPLGYWPLSEASGSTINDSSGNGYNGVTAGGVLLNQPAMFSGSGPCAQFNGSSGEIDITTSAFNSPSTAWTVMACFQFITAAQGFLITPGPRSAGGVPWQLAVGGGESAGSGNTGLLATGIFDGSAWHDLVGSATPSGAHMLAATYDSTTLSLYLDGALVTSTALSATLAACVGSGVRIGRRWDATQYTQYDWFKGAISDAAIWFSTLSAPDIAGIYAAAGTPVVLDRGPQSVIDDTYPPAFPIQFKADEHVPPPTTGQIWPYPTSTPF